MRGPHSRRTGLVRTAALVVFVLVAGFVAPAIGGSTTHVVVGQAGAFAVAVVGYNLIVGEAGLFSMGHAAFMGIAVYAYTISAQRGLSPWLALPLSLVLTLLAAAALGLVTLRLRDVYFAIATFAAAGIVQNLISQLTGLTGGSEGTSVVPLEVFGNTLAGADALYPWIIGSVALAVVFHEWVAGSRFGRKLRCLRDDEEAAAAMGIGPLSLKVRVLVLGAVFAAWAGWLYGLSLSYVDPSLLGVDQTVLILVMLVIGGTGSVTGAIAGAFLVWLIPQLLQPLALWWQFAYGLIVVAVMLAARTGVVGLLARGFRLVHRGAAERPARGGEWSFYVASPALPAAPLRVDHVRKRYGGVQALAGVSAEFAPGVVNALIGPNGSGKSTLVNVITGVVGTDGGGVYLGDTRLTGSAPNAVSRLGVSRTFQSARLFGRLSVLENVLPMAESRSRRRAEALELAERCLASVGLAETTSRPVAGLPQGSLRLLEIARALALEPRAMLLDEPAAGLAEHEWLNLRRLLTTMAEKGLVVVVIEHNMPFVLDVATRITVLDLGRVIAQGTPDEIRSNATVRSAYLGEDMPLEIPVTTPLPSVGVDGA